MGRGNTEAVWVAMGLNVEERERQTKKEMDGQNDT